MSEYKKFLVTLHSPDELDLFNFEMEHTASSSDIPARAVECVQRMPVSTSTVYLLSDEEVANLQKDNRVAEVNPFIDTAITIDTSSFINPNGTKHWVVTLKNTNDLNSFYHDMEHDTTVPHIPQRAVECIERKPTSRNTSYWLHDNEVPELRKDPRVAAVELTPAAQGIHFAPSFIQDPGTLKFQRATSSDQTVVNWGLLRCAKTDNPTNWGSGTTADPQLSKLDLSTIGQNVDVVIVDTGNPDVDHPEFAVNYDGSGGSRMIPYDWRDLDPIVLGTGKIAPYTGGLPSPSNYHAWHVTGVVAGNRQGWARGANIYNLYYDTGSSTTGAADNVIAFIKAWHEQKTPNIDTGVINPTVVNNSWSAQSGPTWTPEHITKVNYRGVEYTGTAGQLKGFSGVCANNTLLGDLKPQSGSGNRIVTTGPTAGSVTTISSVINGTTGLTAFTGPYAVGSYQSVDLPFNVVYAGTTYNKIAVHASWILSFGAYTGTASTYYLYRPTKLTPALPKICLTSQTNISIQKVWTGTVGSAPNRRFIVRVDANSSSAQTTISNSYFEYTFYEATPNQIDVQVQTNNVTAYPGVGFSYAQLQEWGFLLSQPMYRRVAALDADMTDAINAGVIMVGAAGNYSWKIDLPGGVDWGNYFELDNDGLNPIYYMQGSSPTSSGVDLNNITVGNMTDTLPEAKHYLSSAGPGIDIYAPGMNIMSSMPNPVGQSNWMQDPRNISYGLARLSGTSQAAPQVTGIIACALELNPSWTQENAKDWLLSVAKSGKLTAGSGGYQDETDLQGGANLLAYYPYPAIPAPLKPSVTLNVSPTSSQEDRSTNFVFTFTRSGATTSALTVYYTVGGTATLGTDYTGIPIAGTTKSITINAGSTTATITVDPTADTGIEPDETVILTLVADAAYTVGTADPVVATILNDDGTTPSITLAVSPTSVAEDGATNLVFTFTRSGSTIDPINVNYTVSGTALLGIDYTGIAVEGTTKVVTIPAGSNRATVVVDPVADTVVEPNETVVLRIAAGTGYTIGTTGDVTGTINNDDVEKPTVTLTVSPSSVMEDGSPNLVFTFTRSGASTAASLVVNYTVSGSATLGVDYTGVPTTGTVKSITIPALGSSTDLVVNPTTDTTVEGDETVGITLAASTTYIVGTSSTVVGTILNDDGTATPVVTLSVNPGSVLEDGTSNLVYTFTRSGSTTNSLTVNYTVSGTATIGIDYTGIASAGTTKTVTIAPGSSTALVTVDPVADTTVETNETVILTLVSGIGYTIGTPTGVTGVITNDDTTPTNTVVTLAVNVGSVLEDGAQNLVFTFTRTGLTGSALIVNYTVTGTATEGVDYTGTPTGNTKNITIPAGYATASVTVNPTADTTIESNETVIFTLQPGTGYSVGTAGGVTGIIANDDAAAPSVTLSVSPSSVLEDGITNLVFTFTRGGTTTIPMTVNYSVSGTATLGVDYTGIPDTGTIKTITILAGYTSASLTVDPVADAVLEPNETVIITLEPGTGYSIGATSTVTGIIANDEVDKPTISVSVDPASTLEDSGVALVYTFSRTGAIGTAITITYTVSGTANSIDYTGIPTTTIKTITIPIGSTSTTLTVIPRRDTLPETNETVIITISASTTYIVDSVAGSATGIILNDDSINLLPSISLTVDPPTIDEASTTGLVFTFTRSGSNASPLSVNYNVSGNATIGTDYTGIPITPNPKTFTFDAGISTSNITVLPVPDALLEGTESVELQLVTANTYVLNTTTPIIGYIENVALPTVTISVSPASTLEDGTTNIVFTFSRAGSVTNSLTVNYTVGGTATLGTDYTGISTIGTTKTITIPAGASSANVTVNPVSDTSVEPDETVILTIASGADYVIGSPSSATGTILNDDVSIPSVTLSVSPVSVTEDGALNLIFTFTRSESSASPLDVNYTVGGTATLGTDYTGISTIGTTKIVTIPAGLTSAYVTVNPVGDITYEDNETVELTIAPGTGYTIGTTGAVIGTITNDDTFVPTVTIDVSPLSVTEDGTPNLVFTFTRTSAGTSNNNTLTVNYTVGGTATLGTDYTGISTVGTTKTISFASGSATATVVANPVADFAFESDETVILTIESGTGYTVGTPSSATGNILNDDQETPIVTLSVSPSNVFEGNVSNPANVLTYTFIRSNAPTTNALTVYYTVGGSAAEGVDYTGLPAGTTKSITIPAGFTTALLRVSTVPDADFEPNETVEITLAADAAYVIGTSSAVIGTITNDDSEPVKPTVTVSVYPGTILEDGLDNLVFTFTRDVTTTNLIVYYVVSGTATEGTDYTGFPVGSPKQLTIPTGATNASVIVKPTLDTTVEPDETVIVTLQSNANYIIGALNQATGIIANDDGETATPEVSLTINPSSVREDSGQSMVYTFTRTGSVAAPLTVYYFVTYYGTAGYATPGVDYTGIDSTQQLRAIVIPSGASTATVAVTPIADTQVEPNEAILLRIAALGPYIIATTGDVVGVIINDD